MGADRASKKGETHLSVSNSPPSLRDFVFPLNYEALIVYFCQHLSSAREESSWTRSER